MYYLMVAHGTGVIMKKLYITLCYHNTFVERLLQQQEQDK